MSGDVDIPATADLHPNKRNRGARRGPRSGISALHSIEVFGFEGYVLFAGRLLLPIFADPGFPALAGGSVASAEGEGGDVGVGDGNFLRGVLRHQAND